VWTDTCANAREDKDVCRWLEIIVSEFAPCSKYHSLCFTYYVIISVDCHNTGYCNCFNRNYLILSQTRSCFT
jgi:hypothetical protein